MVDWALLQDAYGPASDVPDLLAVVEAGRGDERGVWDDLWGRLCHQDTVYSASYAALPSLAAIAAGCGPAGYVEPLHLAASIIASNDGPEDVAAVRRRYPAELSALRDMAERNLALADGFGEFVYALQALMAFEGIPVWGQNLHGLADEELTMDCPACGAYIYLTLTGSEFTANCDDDAVPGTQIFPAAPAGLSDRGARMHSLALQHGQTKWPRGSSTSSARQDAPPAAATSTSRKH